MATAPELRLTTQKPIDGSLILNAITEAECAAWTLRSAIRAAEFSLEDLALAIKKAGAKCDPAALEAEETAKALAEDLVDALHGLIGYTEKMKKLAEKK